MKSLKESILKSTKTGKSAVIQKAIENFKNIKHIKYNVYLRDFLNDEKLITAESVGKMIKININTKSIEVNPLYLETIPITQKDISSGYLDNIHSIWIDGKCCNITYSECKLKDADEYIKEVGELVYFCGCEIDNITSIPKNCKKLCFGTSMSKPSKLKGEIRDIKLDKFELFCISQKNTLVFDYKNINNVKINDTIAFHQDNFFDADKRNMHKIMFNTLFKDKLDDLFNRNKFNEENTLIWLKSYDCRRIVKNNNGEYQLRAPYP